MWLSLEGGSCAGLSSIKRTWVSTAIQARGPEFILQVNNLAYRYDSRLKLVDVQAPSEALRAAVAQGPRVTQSSTPGDLRGRPQDPTKRGPVCRSGVIRETLSSVLQLCTVPIAWAKIIRCRLAVFAMWRKRPRPP